MSHTAGEESSDSSDGRSDRYAFNSVLINAAEAAPEAVEYLAAEGA